MNTTVKLSTLVLTLIAGSALAFNPPVAKTTTGNPSANTPPTQATTSAPADDANNSDGDATVGPFRAAVGASKPVDSSLNELYYHQDEALKITSTQRETLRQLRTDFRKSYSNVLKDHGQEWWSLLHQTQGLSPAFYQNYRESLWRGAKRRAEAAGQAFNEPKPTLDEGRSLKPGTPEFDVAIKRLTELNALQPDADAYKTNVFAALQPNQVEFANNFITAYVKNNQIAAERAQKNVAAMEARGREVAQRMLNEFNINNPEIPQTTRDTYNTADFEGKVRIMMEARTRFQRNQGKWTPAGAQADASSSEPVGTK